jgi:hypothetical protein
MAKRNACRILLENPELKTLHRKRGVDMRIILRSIKKLDRKKRIGFVQLQIGISRGLK